MREQRQRRRAGAHPSPAALRAARARRQRALEELRRGQRSLALAAVFTTLALAIYGVANWLLSMKVGSHSQLTGAVHTAIRWGSAAAFLLSGVLASRRYASAFSHFVVARSAVGSGPAVRLVTAAVGYTIVFFGLLQIVGIPVAHLLLGAGLAGIVLGIAGQQTLGNVFAGMVLVTARPFTVGDHVRVRSGALGGIFEGDVIAMSLTYVTLTVDGVAIKVPNSGMLAAAVGRIGRRSTGLTGPVPVVPPPSGAVPAVASPSGAVPAVASPSGAVDEAVEVPRENHDSPARGDGIGAEPAGQEVEEDPSSVGRVRPRRRTR